MIIIVMIIMIFVSFVLTRSSKLLVGPQVSKVILKIVVNIILPTEYGGGVDLHRTVVGQ